MRQISFQGVGCLPAETLELHAAYSKSLNLPQPKATAEKLAVVGGGASVKDHIDELKNWDGEIWAINGAARWCHLQGIKASLFSITPVAPEPWTLVGIKRAILSYECDPSLFDALVGHAEVYAFDRDGHGPTSPCAVPALMMKAGFKEVSFFGCEACYGEETHAYQNIPSAEDMIVAIGGTAYRTNAGYFMQTQILAKLIGAIPEILKDRSGGMLSALIADPEGWDVLKLPSEMKDAA